MERITNGLALNFPSISCGLIGQHYSKSSLGSVFYSNFIKSGMKISDSTLMLLPQRVPVPGFFQELCENETIAFGKHLQQIQNKLIGALSTLTGDVRNFEPVYGCNVLDLCARYGLTDKIRDIHPPTLQADSAADRIMLLKHITYKNFFQQANGEVISLTPLIRLATDTNDNLLKALIISRILVTASRYETYADSELPLVFVHEAYEFATGYKPNSEIDKIWISMICRALPMEKTLSKNAEKLMSLSLEHANELTALNEVEKSIKKELIFTTKLSIAKMHGNGIEGKKALEDLIVIDPFDSAGYTELALYNFRQKDYAAALTNFSTAIRLGPPSFAMNTYFSGVCLKELGSESRAIQAFECCIQRDPFGISPHLDLLKIFLHRKDFEAAKKRAHIILASPDLREQLDNDELLAVENV